VKTPGKHTVEQVSEFLKVKPEQLIKTLLYDLGNDGHDAVLVRGDHEVSAAKLSKLLGTARLKLASAQTIERLTGAPVGFAGPVKLKGVRLLADHAVMAMTDAVTGANAAEMHLRHVAPGRDFQPDQVADLRLARAGDGCGRCGKPLAFVRCIEVGHVFKLGTKYTSALGASVQDEGGRAVPMLMGCYGIGVNRIVAAAIEQHHDAQGIIWPPALAPFQVLVSVLEAANPDHLRTGQEAAGVLRGAGRTVLLDDREQSPGSKLKDADLIGVPVQVVVGKVWQADHQLEVRLRGSKESARAGLAQLPGVVDKLLDKAAAQE
jgi:prolyl-tRNA synthetase